MNRFPPTRNAGQQLHTEDVANSSTKFSMKNDTFKELGKLESKVQSFSNTQNLGGLAEMVEKEVR